MQPVVQATNNRLVVDTGRDRILVDTGFGEKIGQPSAAPGHSPSHASILFSSGKEQFMHLGDITHNPVTSLQHPECTPIFDYDPAGATGSRKAILDRVATDEIMAMGYHFPFLGIGRVVKHDKAYRCEAVHWAW